MKKNSVPIKKLAEICLKCPVCSRARSRQKGLAYFFVKYIDRKICPGCRAFEAVTGQKAYEPLTKSAEEKILSP